MRRVAYVCSLAAAAVMIGAVYGDDFKSGLQVGDKADAFNVRKEGLFRSFEWTGTGKYELRAHLTVGDLRLDR